MPDPDPEPATPVTVRARTFAALGHPGFRRFFAGQGISLIGTWVQAAAVRGSSSNRRSPSSCSASWRWLR